MERLQKIIANRGYCSRRKAEELIQNGKVKVNGETEYQRGITTLGVKVSEKDEIMIDGNVLANEQKEYYLLYKPRGIITSTKDEKNRKTVTDLIPTKARIYPVGRLDYDTSGILLLTNDGELTNALIHPKNEIDKVYVAKLKGFVTPVYLKALSNVVIIEGKKTSKAKSKLKKYDKIIARNIKIGVEDAKTYTFEIEKTGMHSNIRKILSKIMYG